MSVTLYPPTKPKPTPTGPTEFELLKASHKFLREEDSSESGPNESWEDQLASKYYASLYREFAVCDLKHYKSGNFALRWRTEAEVLSGAGEIACGNTRCKHHHKTAGPSLSTLELPFAYVEHGENKSALVKVVLCKKCLDKLMWKRRKDREMAEEPEKEDGTEERGEGQSVEEVKVKQEEEDEVDLRQRGRERSEGNTKRDNESREGRREKRDRRDRWDRSDHHRREGRHSRSRSPRRRHSHQDANILGLGVGGNVENLNEGQSVKGRDKISYTS